MSDGSGWGTVGIILAVIGVVAGLAVIGFVIFVVVAINSWGSNK